MVLLFSFFPLFPSHTELRAINLVIEQITSEVNGKKYWGIKNAHSDPIAVAEASDLTKMQTEM